MKFDLEYLEKLAEIVRVNDLSEITVEDDEQAVSLKREKPQAIVNSLPQYACTTSQIVSSKQSSKQNEATNKVAHSGKPVTSPMVGTFYCAPSPEDAPFVKVGDNISIGQVVCIIEAMKLMNEIEADVSGKIVEMCVKNGDSVEFGQPLMYVE